MSTFDNKQPWPMKDTVTTNSKYEKCLNITEEIYKRINITFEIKKLETGSTSDISNSDQIDSNDLSNETDLFAYEKSTSISSSVSDITQDACEKFINLNNNEEGKLKKIVPYITTPRPKKRFRKRVKKRQLKKKNDSDCSSDEGVPLSRIVDNTVKVEDEDLKMELKEMNENSKVLVSTVDETVILNLKEPELHNEILDLAVSKKTDVQEKSTALLESKLPMENEKVIQGDRVVESGINVCPICNANFKGVRGLKRHMTMSHMQPEEIMKTMSPTS